MKRRLHSVREQDILSSIAHKMELNDKILFARYQNENHERLREHEATSLKRHSDGQFGPRLRLDPT